MTCGEKGASLEKTKETLSSSVKNTPVSFASLGPRQRNLSRTAKALYDHSENSCNGGGCTQKPDQGHRLEKGERISRRGRLSLDLQVMTNGCEGAGDNKCTLEGTQDKGGQNPLAAKTTL